MELEKEVWPFNDESSGAQIQKDRFYGFCDSGGLWGTRSGYLTVEEAKASCLEDMEHGLNISTEPSMLGDAACCILTGRQFIDQLEVIALGGNPISDHGTWSKEYVFTFCSIHTLKDNYVVVVGKDWSSARTKMFDFYGSMWGFQCKKESFENQFFLTEVPFETENKYIEGGK